MLRTRAGAVTLYPPLQYYKRRSLCTNSRSLDSYFLYDPIPNQFLRDTVRPLFLNLADTFPPIEAEWVPPRYSKAAHCEFKKLATFAFVIDLMGRTCRRAIFDFKHKCRNIFYSEEMKPANYVQGCILAEFFICLRKL